MSTELPGANFRLAAEPLRWALTNPHLSLHIPKDSRLAVSTQRKRNGMPKRPAYSLKSIVSNLHFLTGVPSFARWPLNLHFLAREAYTAWVEWITHLSPCRPDMRITTDFAAPEEDGLARGISALPLDYEPIKDYAQKARDVVSFEQEGNCLHCGQELESGKGLHAMCPNRDCMAMGHLDCWSKYALKGDECSHVIPDCCECPSCGGYVRWGDMMKELSLRIRGAEEVERLLKGRRRRKKAAAEAV